MTLELTVKDLKVLTVSPEHKTKHTARRSKALGASPTRRLRRPTLSAGSKQTNLHVRRTLVHGKQLQHADTMKWLKYGVASKTLIALARALTNVTRFPTIRRPAQARRDARSRLSPLLRNVRLRDF